MFQFTDHIVDTCIEQNLIKAKARRDFLDYARTVFAKNQDSVIEIMDEKEKRICYCVQDTETLLADAQLQALKGDMRERFFQLISDDQTLCIQDAGEMNWILADLFQKNGRKVLRTGSWWECFLEQPEVMNLSPARRIVVENNDISWLHQMFLKCCIDNPADIQQITEALPAQEVQAGQIHYQRLFREMDEVQLGELLHRLAVVQGKKLAAVYGNCHFDVITKYLCNAPAFRKEYLLVMIPPVFDMEKFGITTLSPTFLGYLDLLIHQNIMQENLYGQQWSTDEIKRYLPEKCQTICVPNTVFFGYFPQEGRRHNTILKNRVNFVSMFCGDKYIDQVYADTGDILSTIQILSKETAIPENDIIMNLNKAFRMLEFQDMGCDIPMKDFVEDNYQKYYLFSEPKHPCNRFFHEMVMRILDLLGLDREIEEGEKLDQENTLSTINRLLYPSVKKVLGLNFSVADYYCDRRLTEQTLSFEEFIEVYIRNTFNYKEVSNMKKE